MWLWFCWFRMFDVLLVLTCRRCCWSGGGCRRGGRGTCRRSGAGWSSGSLSLGDPRCQTAPAASHRVSVRVPAERKHHNISTSLNLTDLILPTVQTFGRCIFWRRWAGSLETPGTGGRTRKPAEDRNNTVEHVRPWTTRRDESAALNSNSAAAEENNICFIIHLLFRLRVHLVKLDVQKASPTSLN